MSRDLGQIKAEAEATLPPLVNGILADTQTLFRQEVQLAKSELKQELATAREAALGFGLSAALGGLAALLLSLALAHILSWATPLPLWASYTIVGTIEALAAAVGYASARKAAEQTDFVPRQTVQTMKENVQWIAGTPT